MAVLWYLFLITRLWTWFLFSELLLLLAEENNNQKKNEHIFARNSTLSSLFFKLFFFWVVVTLKQEYGMVWIIQRRIAGLYHSLLHGDDLLTVDLPQSAGVAFQSSLQAPSGLKTHADRKTSSSEFKDSQSEQWYQVKKTKNKWFFLLNDEFNFRRLWV